MVAVSLRLRLAGGGSSHTSPCGHPSPEGVSRQTCLNPLYEEGWREAPGCVVCSRDDSELVAVGFAPIEDGLHFKPVAVGERALHAVQLILVGADGAEHLVAILFENGPPKLGIAAGD